jgi:hypothetical protein
MMRSGGTPAARARLSSGEGRHHGLVGVRLHGVADERAHVGEGAGEHLVVPLDGGDRIAIERRADLAGEADEVDAFGMEHAVAIVEVVHGAGGRASVLRPSCPRLSRASTS